MRHIGAIGDVGHLDHLRLYPENLTGAEALTAIDDFSAQGPDRHKLPAVTNVINPVLPFVNADRLNLSLW